MNIIEESGDSSVNGIGDENVEVLDRSIENITTTKAALNAEKLEKRKGVYRRVESHSA